MARSAGVALLTLTRHAILKELRMEPDVCRIKATRATVAIKRREPRATHGEKFSATIILFGGAREFTNRLSWIICHVA